MLDDFEKPEKPLYRLIQVCYNCRYFKRGRTNGLTRFGYCTLSKYTNPKIKSLPIKEQKLYFDRTCIDATCDMHQYRGSIIILKANQVCGARPLT